MNLKTFSLLRAVGPPIVENRGQKGSDFSKELYRLAYHNKIPLTYLNSLSQEVRRGIPEFNYHETRFQKRGNLVKEIADLFERKEIKYAVFKTLKPFPEYAADIDILNLGSKSEYERMVKTLTENGYYPLDRGPLATTLCDMPEEPKLASAPSFSSNNDFDVNRMGIMVDVHNEIGISHLVYIDKEKIKGETVTMKISGEDGKISSFPPQVELAINVAHSVIKERGYLLADFYITLQYLDGMSQREIEKFVGFVRENYLENAVRCHLGLTSFLHERVFGETPRKAEKILSCLGGPSHDREIQNLLRGGFQFPHKYSRITWMKSLAEKLHEENFRRSLYEQFLHLPSTVFTRKFLEKLGVF